VLREAGARPIASDRLPCAAFELGPALRADATAPPLRDVPVLIAANLLRHLWDPVRGSRVTATWRDCLAPGGRLYVFEDEPAADPGPARNYRDLQAWLARLVPWRRALLPRADFERCEAVTSAPGAWSFGRTRNQFSPGNRHDVLSLLVDERGVTPEIVKPLADRIAEEGVDYGCFWWARFERERRE